MDGVGALEPGGLEVLGPQAGAPRRGPGRTSAGRPGRRTRRSARSSRPRRGSLGLSRRRRRRGDQRAARAIASDRAHERRPRAEPAEPSRRGRRRPTRPEQHPAPDVAAALDVALGREDHVDHDVADDDDARPFGRAAHPVMGPRAPRHEEGWHVAEHTRAICGVRLRCGRPRRTTPARAPPETANDPRHGPPRSARGRHHPHALDRHRPEGELAGIPERRWAPHRWPTSCGPATSATRRPTPTGPIATASSSRPATQSMLLYSLLHLTGYDVRLDDLKRFRQSGSITPGHPEYGLTAGVEATTGPLGQGFANAVGMAIAERRLAAEFNRPGHDIVDHRTYVICSRRRPAGGRRVRGQLSPVTCGWASSSSSTTTTGSSSTGRRHGHSPRTCSRASTPMAGTRSGSRTATTSRRSRPPSTPPRRTPAVASSRSGRTSVMARPNKQDTQKAHGSPLGPDEVRLTKEAYGWDPDKTFYVPDEASSPVPRGDRRGQGPGRRMAGAVRPLRRGASGTGGRAEAPDRRPAARRLGAGAAHVRGRQRGRHAQREPGHDPGAGRRAAGAVRRIGRPLREQPDRRQGPTADHFEADHAGRNLRFGVREHGMGAIANGIAYHGGFLPYDATFLTFSDYMRGSVRLAALSGVHVIYVWTHDSVGLGEDGPTHQPVEHYAALRAIPNLWFVRPADANETAAAWGLAVERPRRRGPGRTRAHPPEAADPGRDGGTRRGGSAPRWLRPARGDTAATAAADPDRHRLRAVAVLPRPSPWRRGDPDSRRVPALLGALRGTGRGVPGRASFRQRAGSASPSRRACRWAGTAGSATRARSSRSTGSEPAPQPHIFTAFGFTPEHVADVGRRVVRDGLHGRQPTLSSPHGSHPTLAHGDAGVDRTPGSDPGHD